MRRKIKADKNPVKDTKPSNKESKLSQIFSEGVTIAIQSNESESESSVILKSSDSSFEVALSSSTQHFKKLKELNKSDFMAFIEELNSLKVDVCCSIIIPPYPRVVGGIIFKKMEVYFSKIIPLIPHPKS